MANFRGQWKTEWNKRIDYFDKEIGKVEQKTKSKKWSVFFWKSAKTKKKKEESSVSVVFGELDKAYVAANSSEGDAAKVTVKAYAEKVASAESIANAHVTKLRASFDSLMPKKEMTKQELAAKERDLKRMLDILDKDVDALITVAKTQIVLFQKEKLSGKGKPKTLQEALANDRDFDKRIAGMKGAIKKGAAWIAKIDRKPEVAAFNSGISVNFARDLLMEVNLMRGMIPNGVKERKVLDALSRVFTVLGPKQLTGEDARFEVVIKEVTQAKNALTALAKWLQKIEKMWQASR